MTIVTLGRMPASSQASRELSTASLTVVRRALRGLSKPRRWRFLAKNSETEISFWRVAMDSAVSRLILVRLTGADAAELAINNSGSARELEPLPAEASLFDLSTRDDLLCPLDRDVIGRCAGLALAFVLGDCMGFRGMGQGCF